MGPVSARHLQSGSEMPRPRLQSESMSSNFCPSTLQRLAGQRPSCHRTEGGLWASQCKAPPRWLTDAKAKAAECVFEPLRMSVFEAAKTAETEAELPQEDLPTDLPGGSRGPASVRHPRSGSLMPRLRLQSESLEHGHISYRPTCFTPKPSSHCCVSSVHVSREICRGSWGRTQVMWQTNGRIKSPAAIMVLTTTPKRRQKAAAASARRDAGRKGVVISERWDRKAARQALS